VSDESQGPTRDMELDSENHHVKWLFAVNVRLSKLIESLLRNYVFDVPTEGLPPVRAMLLLAMGKGYKTHRAMLILAQRGYGEDASILLRTLFELAVDARYVAQAPRSERALRWLDYDWVERYELYRVPVSDPFLRDLKSAVEAGDSTPVEVKRQAARVQREWGFWRKELPNGELLHPKSWSGDSVAGLAKQVGWGSIYNTLYKLTSMLVHHSPRTANGYLERVGDRFIRVKVSADIQGLDAVLPAGFDFLHAIILAWHQLSPLPKEIESVRQEIASEYERKMTEHVGSDGVESLKRAGFLSD